MISSPVNPLIRYKSDFMGNVNALYGKLGTARQIQMMFNLETPVWLTRRSPGKSVSIGNMFQGVHDRTFFAGTRLNALSRAMGFKAPKLSRAI